MGERLARASDLRCMSRRCHHAATVVKVALNTFFGQHLAGSTHKGVELSARGRGELSLAVSKGGEAL